MLTSNKYLIEASPTKDFFIYMLTKDIELPRVIVDLIDNCVDGALRIRPNRKFKGLKVRVEVNPEHFFIEDNCGGIDVDLARTYAFRFGRPIGMPSTKHSVGQFGVGMKRALFKLGLKFRIESITKTSRFVVEEDINEWKSSPDWQFKFKKLEEDLHMPLEKCGTIITVAPLYENVAKDFGLENSLNRIKYEIRQAHQQTIKDGLSISLNGTSLDIPKLELLYSNKIIPALQKEKLSQDGGSVIVKIYAGISESSPADAGWYIYCNGRMVLGADQTYTTGWWEGDGKTIPKYHNQYARYRGFVFFDSDDAGLLPWNTTKTGVNFDSPIFRAVRLKMITLMRPVIDFLNKLDQEKGGVETDYKPLTKAVTEAKSASVEIVPTSKIFKSPKPIYKPQKPRLGRISYNKPDDQIEKVKKSLKVSTLKEVGERTFDYYYDRECEG